MDGALKKWSDENPIKYALSIYLICTFIFSQFVYILRFPFKISSYNIIIGFSHFTEVVVSNQLLVVLNFRLFLNER